MHHASYLLASFLIVLDIVEYLVLCICISFLFIVYLPLYHKEWESWFFISLKRLLVVPMSERIARALGFFVEAIYRALPQSHNLVVCCYSIHTFTSGCVTQS